jgi:hypothetical protein
LNPNSVRDELITSADLDQNRLFFVGLSQAREEEMVFFNVLSTKQTLFGPKIPISGMLVALHQQERWRQNPFIMDEFPGRSDWLILATINAKLGNTFQDFSSFLPPPTLPLTSPCQDPIPP